MRDLKQNYGIEPGSVYSVHLIEDDLYFDLIFESWTSGQNGGGFSYTRIAVNETGDPMHTIVEPGDE